MPNNLIPIPSNAFSGAAVKFDLSPVNRMLMLSANIDAKNQSRNFAVDKFHEQQLKNVLAQGNGIDSNRADQFGNPDQEKGRSDHDDFMDAVSTWVNHSNQYRREIRNPLSDGGKRQVENDNLYNSAVDIAQRSKAKIANATKAFNIKKDLESKGINLPEGFASDFQSAWLPVNHPGYKPFDLSKVSYVKPWSTSDDLSLAKEVSRYTGEKTYSQPIRDLASGTQTTMQTTRFNENDLNGMADIARNKMLNQYGFKDMIEKAIQKDPYLAHQWATTFSKHFGRDPESEYDLATGYTIGKNPNEKTVQSKPTTITLNPAEKLEMALKEIRARGEQQRANIKVSSDLRNQNKPTISADSDVEKLFNTAKSDPNRVFYFGKGSKGQDVYTYNSGAGQDIKNAFSFTDNVTHKKVTPQEIHFSDDGSAVIPIFKNPDGSVNTDLSNPRAVTRQEFERIYANSKKRATASQPTTTKQTIPGFLK